MDIRRQMDAAAATRRADAEAGRKRYRGQSRARLLTIVRKKHNTTLIGSISRFEEHVGRALWGHGLTDAERTEDQKKWLQVWLAARTEILNNGNNQLRALEKEFEQYEVEWTRYQTDLPVRDPNPPAPPDA